MIKNLTIKIIQRATNLKDNQMKGPGDNYESLVLA